MTDSVPRAAKLPTAVWVLAMVAVLVAIGFGILAPAVPAFAMQFGVSRAWAGFVVSVFALARIASILPLGYLIEHIAARRLLAAGLAIVSVSSLLAGWSTSYPELLLMRGAGGLGSAMFSIAASSILARDIPARVRGRAMGMFNAGFLIGGILGPVFGGTLAERSLTLPFQVYAIALALACAVAIVALPPPHGPGTGKRDHGSRGFRDAWHVPAFRAAVVGAIASSWTMAVRIATIPLFVTEALGLPERWTGYGLGLAAAVNGLLILPCGKLADTRGRAHVLIAGGIGLTAAFALLSAPPALWLFALAMTVLGVGGAAQSVAPGAILGDVAATRRSSVITGYQIAGDIGSFIAPLLVNATVDNAGFSAGFGLSAAVCALATGYAWWARKSRTDLG